MKKFNSLKPFADKKAYHDFLTVFTHFKYKLYGKIKFKVVSQSELEFDLYARNKHYTEQDLNAISKKLKTLNKKWKTKIVFCLFPSKKYPAGILINVRSPNAPFALVA